MLRNSKVWVKVRLNKGEKSFKITQQEFATKSEGELTLGNSGRFAIMNRRNLEKLVAEGWSNNDNVVEEVEQVDPEIERQIEEYSKAKTERDIAAYAKKKASQESIIAFKKPIEIKKEEAFNYDNQWNKHVKKVERRKAREQAEMSA